MVSIVTIWILHFRRRADEWTPRSWSHYNAPGAEITAKFTRAAHLPLIYFPSRPPRGCGPDVSPRTAGILHIISGSLLIIY